MSRSRILLTIILLSGFILRLGALNDQVDYDEAYTVVQFAAHSWWATISDYSLPNNHILHSLLVKSAGSFLGVHPWSIRIPALLAGLGGILLIYMLGKALYSPETGLLAAALAAGFPELIHISSLSRGYSMLAFFTLLIFWLGWRIIRQPNRRDWLFLALVCALGFWTVPIMLYPAGAEYLWLFLEGPKNRKFFFSWLVSGLGTGILTLLFYAPALFISGWRRIFANSFVQPVAAEKYFDWVLVTRLNETWQTWTGSLPVILTLILCLGLILSLVFHQRIQTGRWPLFLVLAGWTALLVLTRRPEAYDRFWAWLIAPLLLWSAAGLVETARMLPDRFFHWTAVSAERRLKLLTGLSTLVLVVHVTFSIPALLQRWEKISNPEASAIYLAARLQPGDVVLAGYPNNAPIWYYLLRLGVKEATWQARMGADQYYLLLARNQKDQTLESILKSYRLDPTRFDLAHASLNQEYGKIAIYTCKLAK